VATQTPLVSHRRHRGPVDGAERLVGIEAVILGLCIADDQIDLRRLEAGDGQIAAEFEQVLKLEPECPIIPLAALLGAVEGDAQFSDLDLRQVVDPDAGGRGCAEAVQGLQDCMAVDHLAFACDQEWSHAAERLDRSAHPRGLRLRRFADPSPGRFQPIQRDALESEVRHRVVAAGHPRCVSGARVRCRSHPS